MKLFLTKLGSCWQSPHHHHHHSVSDSGFDHSENALMNLQLKRRSTSAHWSPALTAISEDNCSATVAGHDDERRKMTKEGLRPRKAIRARVKPSSYTSDLDSSWKVQAQIAIPAFSPAPFMF